MAEKSKMELIKEFIETCPYLKKGKVNVDYIKDKPQSYSIDETPVDPVLQNFLDGGRRLQIQFDFSIQANFSVLENIKNSKFCDDLTDWIYEQNKQENLPKIEGAVWIKCLGRGTILQTTEATAIYVIPMQVAYDEDY
nr:MAG TPA: Minor capsid protein from bacteriophage [Bacteriophage sp.]